MLADKKKEVYDADIAALIDQQIRARPPTPGRWSATRSPPARARRPTVTLTLRRGDEEVTEKPWRCGDGPVDALFLAIEQITGVTCVCKDFRVHA